MKTNLLLPAMLTATIFSLQLFAQQDAMVSQYMFNGMFLNPAYAGVRSNPNITSLYRKQWVNFKGAPETALLSYDQKISSKKMGAGLIIANDKIGVTGQTDFYANYSYHLKIDNNQQIAFGLRGGISNYRAALTDLTIWESDDEIFSRDITGKWIPNFGTGAYYFTEKYYAGFSVPRILNYNPSTFLHAEIDRAPQYERHYYLTGGYNVKLKEELFLKPSILFKYVKDAPVQCDINVNAYFKKIFGIGLSYRTRDAIIAMVEIDTKKRFRIGYAFDYYLNDLADYSNGTHEIMIAYDFEKGISVLKSKAKFE